MNALQAMTSYASLTLPNMTGLLTKRGFTGHEHIDELELIHMNGRVYDPETGRFMSPDPFVKDPYNTQGFNRYAYVLGNPLKYVDPSGFYEQSEGGPPGHSNDSDTSGENDCDNHDYDLERETFENEDLIDFDLLGNTEFFDNNPTTPNHTISSDIPVIEVTPEIVEEDGGDDHTKALVANFWRIMVR